LGVFWRALEWKIMMYFGGICNIKRRYGKFYVRIVRKYFSPFRYILPRNIWQAWFICNRTFFAKIIKFFIFIFLVSMNENMMTAMGGNGALGRRRRKKRSERLRKKVSERLGETASKTIYRTVPENLAAIVPENITAIAPENITAIVPENIVAIVPENIAGTVSGKSDVENDENFSEKIHEKLNDKFPKKLGLAGLYMKMLAEKLQQAKECGY
jgi:hypothetical protein